MRPNNLVYYVYYIRPQLFDSRIYGSADVVENRRWENISGHRSYFIFCPPVRKFATRTMNSNSITYKQRHLPKGTTIFPGVIVRVQQIRYLLSWLLNMFSLVALMYAVYILNILRTETHLLYICCTQRNGVLFILFNGRPTHG